MRQATIFCPANQKFRGAIELPVKTECGQGESSTSRVGPMSGNFLWQTQKTKKLINKITELHESSASRTHFKKPLVDDTPKTTGCDRDNNNDQNVGQLIDVVLDRCCS
jgi:hypothetical protein